MPGLVTPAPFLATFPADSPGRQEIASLDSISTKSTCSCSDPEQLPDYSSKKQRKRNQAACVCEYSFIPHPVILDAFDFVPKLYGRGGINMKEINEACGGKIRLRGRGSRYYELGGLEAPMNLKLYLSCSNPTSFDVGHRMVLELLGKLDAEFERFCRNSKGSKLISKHGAPRRVNGSSGLFHASVTRDVPHLNARIRA